MIKTLLRFIERSSRKEMSSATTIYRKVHPEWREQEKVKDRERFNKLYQDTPQKVKQRALARL